jgi:hypothetical protein
MRAAGNVINSTSDLMDEDVDFLVLPLCDATSCTAVGDYYNDNDTNYHDAGEINKYEISFLLTIASPDEFNVTITT